MRFSKLKIWKQLAIVGFLLFFLALPISKGLVSIAVGVLFGTAVFRLFQRPRFAFPNYWWLPIILFVLLVISVTYSDSYRTAWKALYRQNMLLLLPIAFWGNADICRQYFRQGIQVFVSTCAFASAVTLLFFVLPGSTSIQITETFSFLQEYIVHEKIYAFGSYSPFIDRLQFSYILSTALVLHLYLYLKSKRKVWLFFSFLLPLAALLILGARGAQIAFLISSSVTIIVLYFRFAHTFMSTHLGKWWSTVGSILLIKIIIVLILYLVYRSIPAIHIRYDQLIWEIGTLEDGTYKNYAYEHFTSLRRLVSWESTWQVIQNQPISGVGIGDHNEVLSEQYKQGQFDIPVNSHQQFLYYWAVAGLGAMLTFLLAYFHFFRLAIKSKSWWKQVTLLTFILFYGIVFCFDSPLIYQTGGLAFWSFYLLLVPFLEKEESL
ncbi:MAG: O-antigen ligase family protein [Bacteroidota bacterium]